MVFPKKEMVLILGRRKGCTKAWDLRSTSRLVSDSS